MTQPSLTIGRAAGFGGDRTDAALPHVETMIGRRASGFFVFEMMTERTLALAQRDRRKRPDHGYAPLLEQMIRPVLRGARVNRIRQRNSRYNLFPEVTYPGI